MPAARRPAATLGLERLMLMSLALVLSLAACQEPEQATGPSLSQSALPNSITLTYICGNAFRVRNTNPSVMTVTWDVYKTTEKGTLTLPAKPGTGPYSETYFTTVNKGTVRLFLDGVLIQTKANGNKPPCQLPVVRPSIPNNVSPPDDSLFLLLGPSAPTVEIYRRLGSVIFLPTASDSLVNAFFVQFGATVVGGVQETRMYYIQWPDPGPSEEALKSLLTQMRAFPGVQLVAGMARGSLPGRVYGRYPADGAGFGRSAWAAGSQSGPTWGLAAIRAPLAWGCETGTYNSDRVKVAVLEQAFYPNPDVHVSARVIAANRNSNDSMLAAQVDKFEWHGAAVAGALSASGDNNLGTVGAIWSTDLVVYEMTPANRKAINNLIAFRQQFVPDMITRQPRIISISSDLQLAPDYLGERQIFREDIARLLSGVPGALIVMAAGDEGRAMTVTQVKADTTAVIRATLMEFATGIDGNRMLFVGGTAPGHTLYDSSAWISGVTEIAAPAKSIGVLALARGGSVYSTATLGNGTSFSAPLVAGVAAQLWSMNPFLLASQVKQLLIDGAKQPRLDPTTGQLIAGVDRALSVPGVADQVYELDAYGSLSLLSAGDDATPICGFPVITSFVNNPETGETETSVRIARPGFTPQEIFRGDAQNVTVAQGGRRIGVDGWDSSRNIDFQSMAWSAGGLLPFRGYRQFLERDTAFIDYSSGRALLSIRGLNVDRGPVDVCVGLPMPVMPEFGPNCQLGPIASTGEWVHAITDRSNYDVTGCGPDRAFYGSYLVPVASSGTRQALREVLFDPCNPRGLNTVPMNDVLAWRADGAVAWVGQSEYSYFTSAGVPDSLNPYPHDVSTPVAQQTRFEQFRVVPGAALIGPRTLSGIVSWELGWRSEGSTLISYESGGFDWWGTCGRAVRAGLAPEMELGDSAGPVPYCLNAVMEPLAAPRLGAPLISALTANSTGAAYPSRPPSAAEPRLRALRRRTPQRIVLVN
jgi:hypothetical protein